MRDFVSSPEPVQLGIIGYLFIIHYCENNRISSVIEDSQKDNILRYVIAEASLEVEVDIVASTLKVIIGQERCQYSISINQGVTYTLDRIES